MQDPLEISKYVRVSYGQSSMPSGPLRTTIYSLFEDRLHKVVLDA